jgi:hypothetical protein
MSVFISIKYASQELQNWKYRYTGQKVSFDGVFKRDGNLEYRVLLLT